MTVIATALKHMLAAGMPHDAIVAAVAEMEAALPSAQPAERPRSKGAIRQANYVARQKASQNVTNDADDVTSDEKRHVAPLPLPPNDNNSNPPTPAPENNTPVREAADFHVEAWVAWRIKNPFPRQHWAEPSLWADFLRNRKKKNLPNTSAAHDKLLRDIATLSARTGWPPGEVFRACVEKNWGAIYETDEMKAVINANGNGGSQRGGRNGNAGGRDNRDGFTRALDDEIAGARDGQAGRPGTGEGRGTGQFALAAPAAVR